MLSSFLYSEESSYDKYFSASDRNLYMQYLDQGSKIYSEGLTNSILRSRVRGWFDKVSETSPGFNAVRKAEEAIQALNNVEVKEEKSGTPQETVVEENFTFGYDVFSDSTRVEYQRGVFKAGLYHPAFFGSILNSLRFLDLLTLRMSTQLGPDMPAAFFSYRWNSYVFVAGINQKLSKRLETEFSTSQPFWGTLNPSVYEIKFVFNF